MSTSRSSLHAAAASSAGLAAAICMAISQVVCLVVGVHLPEALLLGLSLSSIAFGGTDAGVFFVGLLRQRDPAVPATV